MATALISLGSNLGDRAATLAGALTSLTAAAGVHSVRASRFYETSPIGGPDFQLPFLNGAALLETSLEPEALLDVLQQVENDHGRVREEHWGPRTLDLDLLMHGDAVLHTPRLTLPHPRVSYRKFVLDGVVEIAADLQHPLLRRSFAELRNHLETAPNYVAFAGCSPSASVDFRSQFAAEAADCGGAKLVDATPRGIPPFAELIASPGLDLGTAIKFIRARQAALNDSLAEAGEKWIVDDGWLTAEASELAARIADDADDSLASAVRSDGLSRAPKLIALLRSKDVSPEAAIQTARRLLPFAVLPPIIDLDYSDRERALTEFAAALDAAR